MSHRRNNYHAESSSSRPFGKSGDKGYGGKGYSKGGHNRSYYHDSYRHDDGYGNNHGKRRDHDDDHGYRAKQRTQAPPAKCRDIEDAFPNSEKVSSIQLADLGGDRLCNFIPKDVQLNLLDWILLVRDDNCPLLSYSETSRSKNTLIDAFAGVGCATVAFSRTSGFDNVVSIESNKDRFLALTNNVANVFKLDKYVEVVNGEFELWMRENYQNVKYFKSVVYIDLVLYGLSGNDSNIIDNATQLVSKLFEEYQCPLVVLRSPHTHTNLVSSVEKEVKSRKVIHNTQLQREFDYLAVLPQLAKTSDDVTGEDGFPSVASKKQFHYIWYNSTGDTKQRATQILCKTMLRKCFRQQSIVKDKMQKFIKECSNDQEIYDKLYDLFQNDVFKSREYLQENPVNVTKMNTDKTTDSSYRANNRTRIIKELLPAGFTPKNMVDIGCSEGSITAVIGRELGLSKDNIHGCDVRDIGKLFTTDFTFSLISEKDNKLPYESNSISLVVALMSLHHIVNVGETIQEVHRILEPNGVLIIREHDCSPKELSLVLDIMHGLYGLVWSNPREMPNFCDEYYAKYRSAKEWSEEITSHRFQLIREEDPTPSAPNRSNSNYRNKVIDDIRNPFRAYHAVFKKQ